MPTFEASGTPPLGSRRLSNSLNVGCLYFEFPPAGRPAGIRRHWRPEVADGLLPATSRHAIGHLLQRRPVRQLGQPRDPRRRRGQVHGGRPGRHYFSRVAVPPKAAWQLLCGNPAYFSEFLPQISDRDLAVTSPADINSRWPAWRLWERLREPPGIDWVIAGKLRARKRPHLIPAYDRVVKSVTGGDSDYWSAMCAALQSEMSACSAGGPSPAATRWAPNSLRSSPTAWDS